MEEIMLSLGESYLLSLVLMGEETSSFRAAGDGVRRLPGPLLFRSSFWSLHRALALG